MGVARPWGKHGLGTGLKREPCIRFRPGRPTRGRPEHGPANGPSTGGRGSVGRWPTWGGRGSASLTSPEPPPSLPRRRPRAGQQPRPRRVHAHCRPGAGTVAHTSRLAPNPRGRRWSRNCGPHLPEVEPRQQVRSGLKGGVDITVSASARPGLGTSGCASSRMARMSAVPEP